MRRFIIGDIHARFGLMKSALEKAGFNQDEDILYSVGDICDRGDEPAETIRFLMGLRDFRPVLGNHDIWLEEYLYMERPSPIWLGQNGGSSTFQAILMMDDDERRRIRRWLGNGFPVIRVEDDAIIVHGGIPFPLSEEDILRIGSIHRPIPMSKAYSPSLLKAGTDLRWLEELIWDRDYLFSALPDKKRQNDSRPDKKLSPIMTERTIFIGHTPLVFINDSKPFFSDEYHLIAIDTGAGSGLGPITVMDMDTKEYWQAI